MKMQPHSLLFLALLLLPGAAFSQAPAAPSAPAAENIRMNFQGAALTDVLNYLSEAAGFVIVQEAPVTGTVNITSRQSITPEEAVDLLNAVLIEKGYTAIRNGRILKIVNRRDAPKRDLPVISGSDPEQIPRKDDMVTQILPLRSGEAGKLIENLRPLLSENATITANEASNSIIMTDTQNNIRRVASIIRAVDSSVSAISTIRVFPLTHADAKELAEVITQLFSPEASASSRSGGRDRDRRSYGGFPGFPGMPGAPGGSTSPQSEAKQAASRVVAVADEQSNSIIVAAPEDAIATIKEIILQVDTSITEVSETKIFRLEHADAMEMAQTFTNLYADPATTGNNSRNGRNRDNNRPQFPFPFGGGSSSQSGQSERSLQQAQVVAVGDPRTNSLIVTASHESMIEIAMMISKLDATDAKKQRVFVHSLEHADAENVATILRSMFGDTSSVNASGRTTNRLTERLSTGAASDAAENFSGNSRGGGGLGR